MVSQVRPQDEAWERHKKTKLIILIGPREIGSLQAKRGPYRESAKGVGSATQTDLREQGFAERNFTGAWHRVHKQRAQGDFIGAFECC